jgi:hypothetical protein
MKARLDRFVFTVPLTLLRPFCLTAAKQHRRVRLSFSTERAAETARRQFNRAGYSTSLVYR